MSSSFNVDIEAGLVSEGPVYQGATPEPLPSDGVYGAGSTAAECQSGLFPGKSKYDVGTTTGSCSSDTPRKACDLCPTQLREQRATETLESWDDSSAESILLFAGLFSMAVSLFIIEGHQRLSPDGAADQAVALFDQLSRLVGIPAADTPFDLSQAAAGSFEPAAAGPSAVRAATTLWFLSLVTNLACVLCALWQRWRHRPQSSIEIDIIDPRRGERPRARSASLARPFSRIVGRWFGLGRTRTAEVVWAALQSSALLFLVGIVMGFVHPINTTVAWILLAYLALLASLHAVIALPLYRFSSPHHPTVSPDSA